MEGDSFTTALSQLLEHARYEDQLARGLHEVTKNLDSVNKPVFCVLAEDCSEAKYKQLIVALCK